MDLSPESDLPAPRVGLPPPLEREVVDPIVLAALADDRGEGDVTSDVAVPAGARARGRLVAKQSGILAGLDVFVRTFELCDPEARIQRSARDGEPVSAAMELARVDGDARALLLAERTALNLLQRMSGVATRTAQWLALAREGAPGVRILDTRKTTPGLRRLEKYAVRCGGGENHRYGLYDEVLLKENHLALAGRSLPAVLADLRERVGPSVRITAEARDEGEARQAIEGGADVVLLDNMTPAQLEDLVPSLRELARSLGRDIELEASGGIVEDSIAAYAAAGVERISIGALTHSVRALDLSLYLDPLPSGGAS